MERAGELGVGVTEGSLTGSGEGVGSREMVSRLVDLTESTAVTGDSYPPGSLGSLVPASRPGCWAAASQGYRLGWPYGKKRVGSAARSRPEGGGAVSRPGCSDPTNGSRPAAPGLK